MNPMNDEEILIIHKYLMMEWKIDQPEGNASCFCCVVFLLCCVSNFLTYEIDIFIYDIFSRNPSFLCIQELQFLKLSSTMHLEETAHEILHSGAFQNIKF